MPDHFFAVVLLLSLTGLFRFIAPAAGVSIGVVSMALFALTALYLLVKAPVSSAVIQRRSMLLWFAALVAWPLLTIVYAPAPELREVGLTLYFFALFWAGTVYTVANGLRAMWRLLTVSLVITLVGIALSMAAPQYFEAVAALAEARVEHVGRPVGFFMQPNRLAVSLTLLFLAWFAVWEGKNSLFQIPAFLAFLGVMLVTGSRMGALLAALIVGIILADAWRRQILSAKFLFRACLLALVFAAGVVAARAYVSDVGRAVERREYDLIARMEALLNFQFSERGGVAEDVSVQARLATQREYAALIGKRPLLGHGFGADNHYLETGVLYLSSHSELLKRSLEYGVLYPLALYLLLLKLYGRKGRAAVERALGSNSVSQFVLVVCMLIVINGEILNNRPFYIILGMFYAVVYWPHVLFRQDEEGTSP